MNLLFSQKTTKCKCLNEFRRINSFALINLVLLLLLGTIYLKASPLPDTIAGRSFLFLAYPGHFALIVFLALVPLLLLLATICRRRPFLIAVSVLLGTLLLLLITTDAVIFFLYRFHLNGMVWNLLTSGVASEVLSITARTWISIGGIAVFFLFIESAAAFWAWGERFPPSSRQWRITVVLLFFLVSGHLLHAWGDFTGEISVKRAAQTLPAFFPLTAKRLMAGFGFTPAARQPDLKTRHTSGLAYPAEALRFSPPVGKPLNLLVLVIDGWRYDQLSPAVAPNIDSLARSSWVFNNHYSGSNCTRYGIFSLMYGLYGSYWPAILGEERGPLLIDELQRRNYRLGIFGSAPLTWPEFDRTVFATARQQIRTLPEGGKPLERDEAITREALGFLDQQNGENPFFGFLFYDAPHASDVKVGMTPFVPYLEDLDYVQLAKESQPELFFNRYKNSVYYSDHLIGKVLDSLEKKGLLDSTVVIITGDHGQEFNDLGLNYWGHNGNFSRFQSKTPLVLHLPGRPPEVFSHMTASYDVVPTLLQELFGCENSPAAYSNGRHLLDRKARPFVHLSTWDDFALVEADGKTNIIRSRGGVEIVDDAYRLLPGADLNPIIAREAMAEMSRFFIK